MRRPALWWALLHAPLVALLYASSFGQALGEVRGVFRFPLGVAFLVEAAFLTLLPYLTSLPFSLSGRLYRYLAPALLGLLTAALFVDSRLFRALGFHVNGLFFRVLVQPGVLHEVGIPPWEAVALALLGLAWLAAETWAGRRFIIRFAEPRLTVGWVALVIGLELVDRVAVASLAFFGGPAVYAAGQVLPMQAPLRINKVMARLTGRGTTVLSDSLVFAAGESRARFPDGVAPGAVRFTRKPDVILVLVESLRADFFDDSTMPRLAARAARGAAFERHYTAATSTHYSLFSLFFGLQSQKLEAVVGAGRSPLLFGALAANGYQTRLIAASSVDWMGLTRTVFGAVQAHLDTDLPGAGSVRDSAMLEHARRFVEGAAGGPLFLFLFFDGTHFNYTFPERSAVFRPYWDGRGSIEAATVPRELLVRRARNSAYEVDRKLDEFLAWFEARRGRAPLVMVTGDHGEEFREHGRVGHGSDVSEEQVHVPMVLLGEGVRPGRYSTITSHLDLVPTLLSLLGDTHPASSYSDGVSLLDATADRFVLSSVGWEPRYAVIGRDLKAAFFAMDGGLGGVTVTDPWDRPLADGNSRFAAEAPHILDAFRRRPTD